MKKYIKPELNIAYVELTNTLLGASRVQNGGMLGNEYDSEDVSYTREDQAWDIWGD